LEGAASFESCCTTWSIQTRHKTLIGDSEMTTYGMHRVSGKATCQMCWQEAEHDVDAYHALMVSRHHDELTRIFSHDRYLEQQRTAKMPRQHHRSHKYAA
jgi:hypothetical protein